MELGGPGEGGEGEAAGFLYPAMQPRGEKGEQAERWFTAEPLLPPDSVPRTWAAVTLLLTTTLKKVQA